MMFRGYLKSALTTWIGGGLQPFPLIVLHLRIVLLPGSSSEYLDRPPIKQPMNYVRRLLCLN